MHLSSFLNFKYDEANDKKISNEALLAAYTKYEIELMQKEISG